MLTYSSSIKMFSYSSFCSEGYALSLGWKYCRRSCFFVSAFCAFHFVHFVLFCTLAAGPACRGAVLRRPAVCLRGNVVWSWTAVSTGRRRSSTHQLANAADHFLRRVAAVESTSLRAFTHRTHDFTGTWSSFVVSRGHRIDRRSSTSGCFKVHWRSSTSGWIRVEWRSPTCISWPDSLASHALAGGWLIDNSAQIAGPRWTDPAVKGLIPTRWTVRSTESFTNGLLRIHW